MPSNSVSSPACKRGIPCKRARRGVRTIPTSISFVSGSLRPGMSASKPCSSMYCCVAPLHISTTLARGPNEYPRAFCTRATPRRR
eukprot:6172200-Pleurochrysis_carterae.AAC.2